MEGARALADAGHLAFGTVDTFLLWRLTGGRVHATDATNASRTLLYDIHRNDWDDDLLKLLGVPRAMLPEVKDSAADFGATEASLFGGAIAIRGVAGDQQAATVGQACFEPGMVKSTYGTGCFAVLNTGDEAVASKNKLLTTIAYRLDGRTTYALEGSIFIAGAAVQWLRDGLKLIERADQSGILAAEADPSQEVILVPAFTGLGAPHWDAEARGALFGLTRATGPRELARAALEAVAFQTLDLVEAMRRDWAKDAGETVLRVDGGMVASDWTMQRLADILERAGRPPRHPGDDGARRRLACRTRRRRLARHGGVRALLATRPPLRAADGRSDEVDARKGLAERRKKDARRARVMRAAGLRPRNQFTFLPGRSRIGMWRAPHARSRRSQFRRFRLICLAASGAFAADGQPERFNASNVALGRATEPDALLPDLHEAALRYVTPRGLQAAPERGTYAIYPLHWAALGDDVAVASRLVDRGVAVDARDGQGRTPLMVAAAFESVSVAELLLARGADPIARDTANGNTPLDFAAAAGQVEVAKLLLAHGASVHAQAPQERRDAASLCGALRPSKGDRAFDRRRRRH